MADDIARLNRQTFPELVKSILVEDHRLRDMLLGRSTRPVPATQKQKQFARRLKIDFPDDISKFALSELILIKMGESSPR